MHGASAPLGGAHLLLVEDDPALRALVVDLLTEEGYRAHSAPDGAAGLALLACPDAPPVGAVLVDWRLPDMDGEAFAAGYRRLGTVAPLLLFTAAPPAEAAAAAARVGAAGIVPKPFDVDEFLAVVDRFLAAPAPPAAARGAPPPVPPGPESDARRRQLVRLQVDVGRVRAALAQVQAAARDLAAIEATRALTPAEARRATALRRESEALRLELALFGTEFERLRVAGRERRT